MAVIPALGKPRQEDRCTFDWDHSGVEWIPGTPELQSEALSLKSKSNKSQQQQGTISTERKITVHCTGMAGPTSPIEDKNES